ncbi:hypothetical protein Bpfe_000720 [Biomphalaria pfeifferi]|uniref:Uncharacterized protein n=1 Tax=Biomphalaria pfeifferi TaxID=112525 RepID=A0AAD8FMP7_BIOPF|nr:hypothetical protein Bpfe_000720 [Biomphalaria pfeifferi]
MSGVPVPMVTLDLNVWCASANGDTIPSTLVCDGHRSTMEAERTVKAVEHKQMYLHKLNVILRSTFQDWRLLDRKRVPMTSPDFTTTEYPIKPPLLLPLTKSN